MPPVAKQSILDIQPYKGGLSKAKSNNRIIKLSSNEAALGASPKAIEAFKESAKNIERYPDGSAAKLRQAIARTYGLNADNIVCGAGSDEIISFLCLAYAGRGDEVIYTEHGFLMYKIYSLSVGATPVAVSEDNLKTSVDSILKAVNLNTKIVFIANPNNPTGTYINKQEVIRLRENLRGDILLVLDGAYAEFVDEPDYTAGSELVEQYDNIVMTRTFSKIHGLASLRVGWGYCPENVADILNRVRGPFNVTSSALDAAAVAVEDLEFINKAKDFNNEQLSFFERELNSIGIKFIKSYGNFILLKFQSESEAKRVYEYLMDKGVITRPVGNYGLPEYLRISIGLADENKLVIDYLKECL